MFLASEALLSWPELTLRLCLPFQSSLVDGRGHYPRPDYALMLSPLFPN